MKKQIILGAVMAVAAAFQCAALEVDVTRINGYYTYPGGEFSIEGYNLDSSDAALFNEILGHYSQNPATQTADIPGSTVPSFQTFCNSGSTGLQGNPQSAVIVDTSVSLGAAWLYSQFAQGTLTGYDYNAAGAGGIFTSRGQAAYGLQNAIWALDGTGGFDVDPTALGYSYYLDMATNMFGAAAFNPNNGAYGVAELYLTYDGANGTVVAQPMLVCVPDGGSTVILLGMALTGIGFVTRRLMRA